MCYIYEFCGQYEPPVDQIARNKYFSDYSYQGVMIDVGACHPQFLSNSYHFEKNGWEVVAIDPIPEHVELWKGVRTSYFLNYAVSDYCAENVVFNCCNVGGFKGSASALILDEEIIRNYGHLIDSYDQISVSVRSLNWILEEEPSIPRFDHIDLLSIDVEGGELAVLQGIDLERWNPKCLVIENTYEHTDIREYLTKNGYKMDLRHEINEFFSRIEG